MALIDNIKPLLLAAGFLFIIVGLNILIVEQPTYSVGLSWIYTLVLYSFYLYLVFGFISIIVGAFDALLAIRRKGS
jgi:hypothetical protein